MIVSVEMKKKKNQVGEEPLVDEKKFDAVLSKLLTMKPLPMKEIKTQGKRGSKAPMFPPKRSAS
jgi:hypothetical protein